MRARSIKPGICDNEILGKADPFCTLLFERLWMMADREGRLEDRPARIKAKAFPYRDGLDVEPLLAWLAENEFIARYGVDRKHYIQILEFSKHQHPHKNEVESVIPPLDGKSQPLDEVHPPTDGALGLTPSSLTPSSLTPDCGLLTADCSALATAPLAESKSIAPEGEMAVALRDLGVVVTSMDPTLIAWIRDGITVPQAVDAVGLARIRKPWPERIPAKYLDPILRQPQKPPQPRLGKFDRVMATMEDPGDVGFG